MSTFTFFGHIPLLRIEDEVVEFAGGQLWRMPFGHYDAVTSGAFSDHGKDYEATAPVFFRLEAELDWAMTEPVDSPPGHVLEVKGSPESWATFAELGLGYAQRFQHGLMERVRAALLLAAPAAGLPPCPWSAMFVLPPDGRAFKFSNDLARAIRMQGDADQEYFFLPEMAGTPLALEVLGEAKALLPLVDAAERTPELQAALQLLLLGTTPVLRPAEQLTLGVVALEALLLPEIKSGLSATFARRLSALLAADDAHEQALVAVGRGLYDARSAGLHGEAPRSPGDLATAAAQAHAQQLLAMAIRRLGAGVVAGQTLAKLRLQLDARPITHLPHAPPLPLAQPPGLLPAERLVCWRPPRMRTRFSSDVDLSAPKDTTLLWSPLIGLEALTELPLASGEAGVAILPLSGPEMVGLEDKDIVRDFIAQLRVQAHPAAVLMIGMKDDQGAVSREGLAPLLRRSILAVTALRLAGFAEFHDPELLGPFAYWGKFAVRYPSVLRQTIEQQMRRPAEQKFGEAEAGRVQPLLRLLVEYDSSARDPQIDHLLALYRRGFDQRFLPAVVRAGLLLSVIEGILGRFRPPRKRVQLEQLVAAVGGPSPAVQWFTADGRKFRNRVAHGQWPAGDDDRQPLEHLLALAGASLLALLAAWCGLGEERQTRRPGAALVVHLLTQINPAKSPS